MLQLLSHTSRLCSCRCTPTSQPGWLWPSSWITDGPCCGILAFGAARHKRRHSCASRHVPATWGSAAAAAACAATSTCSSMSERVCACSRVRTCSNPGLTMQAAQAMQQFRRNYQRNCLHSMRRYAWLRATKRQAVAAWRQRILLASLLAFRCGTRCSFGVSSWLPHWRQNACLA